MTAPQNDIIGPSWRHALFVCVVTLLVYSQTVTFPFLVLDDAAFIVKNPRAHTWSALPSYFTGVVPDPVEKNAGAVLGFYRPLSATWVLVCYKLFGLRPALWHLASVFLYLIGVWLLWRLAWELTQDHFAALIAAIIYGLHPLHVEGVAWLSGAAVEPLVNAFFLGAFLAYLSWRKDPGWGRLLSCAALTLCALLSKETALALPVLIVAHAWIFREVPVGPAKPDRSRAFLTLTMVSIAGFYFLLRTAAIHTTVTSRPLHSWADIVRTAPLLFVIYLRQAIWPVRLGMWYDTQVVGSFNQVKFYLPLVFCVAYAGLTLWAIARKPKAGFLMLWWMILLAIPIAGLRVFPDSEIIHDRFSFIALSGFCVLLALLLRRLPEMGPSLFGFKAPHAVALASLIIVLSILTAFQVHTWSSDMSMYAQATEVAPRNARPRVLLANEYLKRGDVSRALAFDRDAVSINPDQWEALLAYGMTLNAAGNRLQAQQVLAHGNQVAPTQTVFYFALAKNLAEMGRFDEAAAILERGMTVCDNPQALQRPLADVRALQQRFDHKP